MRNLLTNEEKKSVKREYCWRLIVLSIAALLVTTLVGILCILPSYILSRAKERVVMEKSQKLNADSTSKKLDAARGTLTGIALREKYIANTLVTLQPSKIIDALVAQKGAAISLQGFNFKKDGATVEVDSSASLARKEGAPFTALSITGVAQDRASLTAFAKRLEALAFVKSVEVPVFNFEKGRGIDFTVSILLK